jgi:hypothetical protein
MTPLSVEVPYPVFTDRNGEPLENGYVWIGTANLNPQTNPIQVYFDKNLTQPAAQPLRTVAGYISNAGTPAQIYVNAANFSILVQDKNGTMVYNFPDGTGISPDACGVTYNVPFPGGISYPVCEKLEQTVSVKDFGAVGDGVTDDTAAIQAALNSGTQSILFPEGTYKVTSTLTIQQNQEWVFVGGQRAASLSKAFNGDLVVMKSLSRLYGANLICNGATYSGRGIYVDNGFSHVIQDVRVDNSQGVCLEFADMIGAGANISSFEGFTSSPTTVPAIKITDTTGPAPKFFSGIWLSGGNFDLSSGGNGSSISNFFIRGFITDANSELFHATNGRCATGGATTEIFGNVLTFTNISFAGPVLIKSPSSGIVLDPSCSVGFLVTEEVGCQFNKWFDNNTSYTPTWTQSSGTQPVIGNGTMTGAYARMFGACHVILRVVFGSTSTFGNNATAYRFSLPFVSRAAFPQEGIAAVVQIGATTYPVWATIGANGTDITFSYNGQSVRDGFPAAWSSGDSIKCAFTYLVR